MMKVRLINIPTEGLAVDFALNCASLNRRAAATEMLSPVVLPTFVGEPQANLFLQKEALTVIIKGTASATFQTVCARCAEQASDSINVDILLVLKPFDPGTQLDNQIEDVNLGFYNGQDIECDRIAEEFVLLNVPISVVCKEDCKGLCASCGTNLNLSTCSCEKADVGDERLAILRGLKV